MITTAERFAGCLLGLAAGDAVGTTLEFKPRGSFEPITDMVGGGPFRLKLGQWTDDTSMALCLAASLVEQKRFDALDQVTRYVQWWRSGYMSSTGHCFDIGNATSSALYRFEQTQNPFSGSTHSQSAGNGSIMRLAPVPMAFFRSPEETEFYSVESSRTTHGAKTCLDACRLFGAQLHRALAGQSKEDILFGGCLGELDTPEIQEIAQGKYTHKTSAQIMGSGYVVKSLEAALWCFYTTNTFEEAVLKAANLGDDADTTAAVVGQVAGAFYGVGGIPTHWLEILAMRKEIEALALQLLELDPLP